jgi:hypothetical protein
MLLKTLAAEKLSAEDLVVVPRRDRGPVNWHRCRPSLADYVDSAGGLVLITSTRRFCCRPIKK